MIDLYNIGTSGNLIGVYFINPCLRKDILRQIHEIMFHFLDVNMTNETTYNNQ